VGAEREAPSSTDSPWHLRIYWIYGRREKIADVRKHTDRQDLHKTDLNASLLSYSRSLWS